MGYMVEFLHLIVHCVHKSDMIRASPKPEDPVPSGRCVAICIEKLC